MIIRPYNRKRNNYAEFRHTQCVPTGQTSECAGAIGRDKSRPYNTPKLQVSKIIPIFAVDNSLFAMPEIFRFYGFSFFFYSREHEPLHIHVEGKGGMAKFDWDGGVFVLSEMHGIKPNDLK